MGKNKEHNLYQRFKGHREGYCSICNELKILTEDHIPPKACGNTNVKIGDFLHNMKEIYSSKGLVLKTICKECNGMIGEYDEKLAVLYKYINSYINSTLTTYGNIEFKGNIEDIKKSIVGHILAGFDTPNKADDQQLKSKGIHRITFREYMLNNKPLPNYIKIHYWYHLNDKIIFNPGFGYTPNYRIKNGQIVCSLMKIRPLAFMIADYSDTNIKLTLPELKSKNEDTFFIRYDSQYFLHPDYPFNVNKNGIIMFSSENNYYAEKINNNL